LSGNGREIVGKWSGSGREVVGKWSGSGREVVGKWSGSGREIVGKWSGNGREVVGGGETLKKIKYQIKTQIKYVKNIYISNQICKKYIYLKSNM
jgi:hypothetical protein